VIPYGMWVPVVVWQPCELLYTCYLLTYLLTYVLSWSDVIGYSNATALRRECWWLQKNMQGTFIVFYFTFISAGLSHWNKVKQMLKEAFVSHFFIPCQMCRRLWELIGVVFRPDAFPVVEQVVSFVKALNGTKVSLQPWKNYRLGLILSWSSSCLVRDWTWQTVSRLSHDTPLAFFIFNLSI